MPLVLLVVFLALVAGAFLVALPSTVRSLPDCRRGWQLRRSRSREVRREFAATLRTGRPVATPALARDVLEYVEILRRGVAVMRTPAWWTAGFLLTAGGVVGVVDGVLLGSVQAELSSLVLVAYPLTGWMYVAAVSRRAIRAERANADLAQRPEQHVPELDCISN